MDKFKKRTFKSLGEFIEELKFIIKNRKRIKKLEAESYLMPNSDRD